MTRKFFIVLLVVILAGIGVVVADDYIDDVYYWEDGSSQTVSDQDKNVNYQQEVVYQQPNVQVTFIEDSITQKSDTVVKAVIHR